MTINALRRFRAPFLLALVLLVVLIPLLLRPAPPTASGCPNLPWPMMSTELEAACTGQYAGTVVRISSPVTEPEQSRFDAAMRDFESWTGIDIQYEASRGFEVNINAQVQAGIPADLVSFPQPGLLKRFVEANAVIDVSTFLHPDWLQTNYAPDWLEMAEMNGITAGVWWRYSSKSLIWYAKQPFESAGYRIPQTWEELLELTNQMVVDGRTPWCIGMESGVATGWIATDWIEDILLRTTSVANYDRWSSPPTASERLPFASPEVKAAAERMAQMWFTEGYVFGGRGIIAGLAFNLAPARLFTAPPGCYLLKDSSSVINYMGEGKQTGIDYDFFPFPTIDPAYGNPALIAGDIIAMFKDRPEVRAVLDFLSRGESIRPWLAQGGALSPHLDTQPDWYANETEQQIAALVESASAIRFDGADLMPAEVGTAAFWRSMTNWVNGNVDLDTALTTIDAAWPND
ncbi:MAG: carbohydrate ABC transporter substrate-binding protein [Anaerolineae bacterium]|nr:carbohydrate ABC transporter substrate-binding protein [Anaerolineae bacterium]